MFGWYDSDGGLESPLIHSGESQTACPVNRLVGLAKEKPAAAAAEDVVASRRSAAALSRVISEGENQVSALQSVPSKILGYPTTTTVADGARFRIAV